MNVHEAWSRGSPRHGRLDELVRAAAAGDGSGLRIVGERGAGKSSALGYAVRRAAGFRVVRLRVVAAEREIPYAALHLLWAGLIAGSTGRPAPHRPALDAAFGLSGGSRPDALTVGTALLESLDGLDGSPCVCIAVDDAHWLDTASAEVLGHVARGAAGRPLLILIAGDGVDSPGGLGDLPVMRLDPLSVDEARRRLRDVLPGVTDPDVADRMLEESGGDVHALAESLSGWTATDLAGGFAVPAPHRARPCARGRHRHDGAPRLAPGLRLLLLAAAADPTGNLPLFQRMAAEFGADPGALVSAGLIEIGRRVTFTCSELRSVTYHSATSEERRLAHRELGRHAVADAAWRAWHLSLATVGHDDELADRLVQLTDAVPSRGGAPARAAFLERAAVLTSDRSSRADRWLAASAAKYDSGDVAGAQRILALTEAGPPDAARAARHNWQRTRIDHVVRPGVVRPGVVRPGAGRAAPLLDAARRLGSLELADSHEAFLETLLAAMSAGDDDTLLETAKDAVAATAGDPAGPVDRMLHGLAVRVLDGYADSVPHLRAAVAGFRDRRADARTGRWLGLAGLVAADLWDAAGWTALTSCPVSRAPARAHGSAGRVADAVDAAELLNAAGHYDRAVETLRPVVRPEQLAVTGWALAELVEAAARTGDRDLAASAAAQLAERTTAAGTDWALGVQAMAEALLTEGADAEAGYRQAIERLTRTGLRGRLARAELLYGEWLRRRNRRVDARVQLRAAGDHFAALGATAFAERACGELLATGEATRKRGADGPRHLSPQEARVASLARTGLSNAEIAEQLFVSTRTVEYHLYKVFAKLGVNSRAKL
jgi:DNA-binding CsgD family transcriptional regulator